MALKSGQVVKVTSQQLQLNGNAPFSMMEWEQQSSLNEKTLQILQQLEELQEDKKKVSGTTKRDKKAEENTEVKISFSLKSSSKQREGGREELAIIGEIREVNKQNLQFLSILNEILDSLGEVKKHFAQLESDKQRVVSKINDFYLESSNLIEEQKRLLELQQEIKTNLQYYLAVDEIEYNIDAVQKDPTQRNVYDYQLQRYLSEIIDGIIFFDSHPSFQQQGQLLEVYQKLKQRLIGFIKNSFFKIFNKEFAFINEQLSKNIFKNMPAIFKEYKNFLQFSFTTGPDSHVPIFNCLIKNQSQIWRCLLGIGVFPQLKKCFALEHLGQKFSEYGVKDLHYFELNETVRNLISFIEVNGQNDIELDELYGNVFLKYMTYCRINFHKELLECITNFFNSLDHQGNKGIKKSEALNCFIHFSFEQLLHECMYTAKVFNFSTLNTVEAVKSHWQNLFDMYLAAGRPLISWDLNNLDLQLENSDLLSGYINNLNEIITYLTSNCQVYQLLFEDSSQSSAQIAINAFKDMIKHLFERLRGELSGRLVGQAQQHIQEKIISFDFNAYCKASQLIISKFRTAQSQRGEVFLVVTNSATLFKSLNTRVEKSSFQSMVCDIVTSCVGSIYIVAERYQEKFDAMLFVIKNTLLLNDQIIHLRVDFTIKEQELDFSETKSFISDIQMGKLSNLYKGENIKAENIWNTTTNFFRMIYNGMPKLKEFTIDLRNSMAQQLKQALDSLNRDMTFIIAKSLIDFIKRYQLLKEGLDYLRDNSEQEQPELTRKLSQTEVSIQKDLSSLLDQEVISRCYHIFIQNLSELTEEMVSKMNNYLEEQQFNVLAKNIKEIIENCSELFSQFQIILSKHLPSEQYDSFNFPDPAKLKKEEIDKIKFVELANDEK